MGLFIESLWRNPQLFWMQILVVVFSICCHEFAHAYIALTQGDSTAADRGHLTFNPFKQMGVFSLIMLAMIGLAWGQVPVDPSRMRHRWSDALVSFAGPATNLLLFLIFSALLGCGAKYHFPQNAKLLFLLGGYTNAILFVINILPVPGFDGWHILTTFKPNLLNTNSEVIKGAGLGLILLLFLGLSYISWTAREATWWVATNVYRLLSMIS